MKPEQNTDRNEDPITGEPGSHPMGVGLGTTGGAAAGAAMGGLAGPVGAAIGAVAGGVAGAFTGKEIAEDLNPTEDAYWREHHRHQPWASEPDTTYEDFEPAYRFGYTRAGSRRERWNEHEARLEREWDEFKGKSRLKWDKAKDAARAGWHRVEDKLLGDADGDGH